MPVWPKLISAGQEVSLEHLSPFEFIMVLQNGAKATLSIHFSCHCFTRAWEPSEAMDLRLGNSFEGRVFYPLRYGLSLRLPEIIRSLPKHSIGPTREGNLVRIEIMDGFFYNIFFSLKKESPKRVRLFVHSAYPADAPRHQKGRMRFERAVALTLADKHIKFA